MKKRAKLLVSIMCAAICLAGLVTSVWAAVQTEVNFNTTIKFDASNQVFADIKGEVKIGGELVSTYLYEHNTKNKSSAPEDWAIGNLLFDGSGEYTLDGVKKTVKAHERIEIILEITNYSQKAISASIAPAGGNGIENASGVVSTYASSLDIDTINAPYIYEKGTDTTACTHKVIKVYTLKDLTTSFTEVNNNLHVTITTAGITPADSSNFAGVEGDTLVVKKEDGAALGSVPGFLATIPNTIKTVVLPGTMTTVPTTSLSTSHNVQTIILSTGTTTLATNAFQNATTIKNVVMPDSCVTLNYSCFDYCPSLKNLYFGKITSLTTIFGNVARLNNIEYLEIPGTVSSLYIDYLPANMKTLKLNEGITSLRKLNSLPCSVESLYLPSTCTSFDSLLSYCFTKLKTIEVSSSNANYSAVDGVLYNKNKTTLVFCPPLYKQSTLALPNTVTTVGANALAGNKNVEILILPASVKSLSNQFTDANNVLKEIIGPEVTTLAANIFNTRAFKLEKVYFPKLTAIPTGCFYGCSSLKEITIPAAVTTIPSGVFTNCTSLTKVYMEGDAPTIVPGTFGVGSGANPPASNPGFTIYVKEQYRNSYTQTTSTGQGTPSVGNWAMFQIYLKYIVV